jgi:hypothetical protein
LVATHKKGNLSALGEMTMISYDLPAFSERVELDALDFGVIISPTQTDADVFADFLDVFLFFSLGQFSLLFAAY